jgi:hypothetical protein
MMFDVLKRTATGAARTALLSGAVAVLVAGSAPAALAIPPSGGGGLTPELSPGALGGAMTLLSGALLLVRERLRSSR